MKKFLLALSIFTTFITVGCEGLPSEEPTNQSTNLENTKNDSTSEFFTTQPTIFDETTIEESTTSNQTYTLSFLDYNDLVIYEGTYDYNTDLSFLEVEEPAREGYTFNGWDQTIPLTMPSNDVVIRANYAVNYYTITWKDADDSVIGTTDVEYGSQPTYSLPSDTTDWNYTGWTPSIEPVTGEKIYTAVREDIKTYINNQVLIDNDDFNITVVETDEDSIWGYGIKIYIENKSDMELMFSLDEALVNGYVIGTLWADSLPAGTKANHTIRLSSSDMEESGITTADKIELYMSVYDNNDWMADDLLNNKYTIYPTGLTEQEVVSPNRPSSDTENVLIDNEHVTLVIIETYEDSIWGDSLKIYLENKTDMELMFTVNEAVVNGYVIGTLWAKSLPAGAKAVDSISLSSSDMEESGITTVDKIELYFSVYDNNDWMADDLINNKYTIYPTGLSEAEIVSPERPSNQNEYVVVDNEDLTFVIIETYEDSIWGYSLKVFIENKTDMELMFTWDDVSVNSFLIDPIWATTLVPNSKTITSISFFESDFEENNILSVEKIDFTLSVYDSNDWMAADLINSPFTYRP